jgi:murein DD-endopeptidase MepM/ murein hydrolase activator NlpD
MASRLPMATPVRRPPSTLQRILPRGIRLSDLAADRRGAPLLVLALLVVASLVAVVPLSSAQGTGQGTGGTVRDDARRDASLDDRAYLVAAAGGQGPRDLVAVAGPADEAAADDTAAEVTPAEEGPFSTDGTLIKPYTVDTTAPEGIEDRVRLYRVRPGDSLSGIANRFGVELMTIWWANKLQRTDALRVGQQLVIPPADGVLHTVVEGDTLASVARKYKVQAKQITRFNQIEGNVLVLGQVLLVPGGEGKPIPKPKPVYVASPGGSGRSSGSSSGGSCSSCSFGGSMRWPVAGGHISQYFHYGHYGLDIAAPYGTPVLAGAGGSVIFAGWRDNGGGYQVWISHGNGVYTTYNHMSSVSVGGGASVGAGQQVGRIGATGWATGPHLHFEVWMGQIWNGGYRANPLNYL